MDRDFSNFPPVLRRILQSEDTRLGFLVCWFLGLTIFPLGAFYFGTIAASNHVHDLRVHDMHVGGVYALGGLALGVLLGLWATFVYPRLKERELLIEHAHHHHLHHELTHHEEISTDVGQEPEHHENR